MNTTNWKTEYFCDILRYWQHKDSVQKFSTRSTENLEWAMQFLWNENAMLCDLIEVKIPPQGVYERKQFKIIKRYINEEKLNYVMNNVAIDKEYFKTTFDKYIKENQLNEITY